MNITELIDELQQIQREHGDIHVSGVVPYGNPEMTIHGILYEPAGALPSARPEHDQNPPERVIIEWKFTS